MNYRVEPIPLFEKQFKKLCKKHVSLKEDILNLEKSLIKNPFMGVPLGNDCFKIRLAVKSKGKGKSGGARIITHFYFENNIIYLLNIFDKSEKESISDLEIENLLKYIP